MIDKWIVFGGWAADPLLLKPLFGGRSAYLDTNRLVPRIVNNGRPAVDWPKLLAEAVASYVPDGTFGIAGWSAGAIVAWALAPLLKPSAGVFIAATPSFCRRPGFLYGQKAAAVRSMRLQLRGSPVKVLERFYEQCGIATFAGQFTRNTVAASDESVGGDLSMDGPQHFTGDNLIGGLYFLERANLLPIEKSGLPTLFLHGTSDAVIPATAGRYFADAAGGKFVGFEGNHAFFMGKETEVSHTIAQFAAGVSP